VDLQNEELKKQLDDALKENLTLKKTIEELELRLQQYEGVNRSKSKSHLAEALLKDSVVNG
jgi:hypothetical protein